MAVSLFMADSDLSLLFRLRGDAAGLKTATAEGRAAVNQLKQAFGPELVQTVSATNKAFNDVGIGIASLTQRIPVVGVAVSRLTDLLRSAGVEGKAADRAVSAVANSIGSIARESGKSIPQVAQFLTRFTQIKSVAERDSAAVEFFGATLATKLTPELAKASVALNTVSAGTAAAGASIGALAVPVAAAVIVVAALVAGLVLVSRELFNVSKQAAAAQGRMFDLSQQTGIAVETLSALEIVAKTTGGEIGNLTTALITFQRRLDDTSDPTSKAAAQFKELGIDARDTETAFRQAFTAIARMPQGFQQTNDAAELFGARGGKQVLAIIKETNGNLDEALKRFRELGILISESDARAADRFNDELELLNFQLRSLGFTIARDLIPELTGLVRAFSDVVRAAKPLLGIIGTIAGPTTRAAASSLRGLGLVVQALTLDFAGLRRSIKEANEEAAKAKDIPALTTEGPQAAALPTQKTPQQQAQETAAAADVVVASAKRSVATTNQALEQLFEQGRINREKLVDDTIAQSARLLKAETDRIDALIATKQKEFKALDRERLSKQEVAAQELKLQQDADKLNQDKLDKQAEFERESTRLRARAAQERADSLRSQIDNETNILVKEFDRQIKEIEAAIARSATPEADGLTTIEALEKAKIDARIEGLEAQKRIGFLSIEEVKVLNQQIQQLNQERDQLEDDQRQRRLARERATAERVRDINLASIDALLEVEQIRAERLIAATEALADARVVSEENAARKILAIRLRLIDSEIEATETRLRAATSIVDVNERTRTEAELSNRLRILREQRVTIETQGEREIEASRQRDLQNEERYQRELEDLREQSIEAERDAAEEVIRLMVASFARRRDIVRAERDLELLREEDRHRRETERINQQKRDVDEEIRLLERRLARLKIGTTEEIEEHGRLIESLEKLRAKRAELDAEQKAEDKRTQTRKRRVTVEIDFELADPDTGLQDLFDDIGKAVTDLGGKFAELIGLGAEFSAVSAQIAQQIGGTLAGAFGQFANALGQTVANWVLLGETGPAVMRKILAQALASLAAEATVQAVKELALGFATLFFNPAESAGHFIAAGLWASIAGGSALGGRALAGNLFKKPEDERDRGRSGGGSTGRDEPRPIDLIREQLKQELHIFVHGEPGGRFNEAVIVASIDDVRSNGPLRTTIKEAGKD